MARIRTIKPEFFTSDDIVELEPIERLFYIALWCEADREGRMVWSPGAIKRRYFPDDAFDVSRVMDAFVTRGLLVQYTTETGTYGFIPTFKSHQHINGKEAPSCLPEPPAVGFKKATRQQHVSDALATRPQRVSHAPSMKEGKGKERKGTRVQEHGDSFSQNGSALTRTEQIKRYAQIKGIPVEDVPEDLFPQVVTL